MKTFRYTTTGPASKYEISHNLGVRYPVVTLFNNTGNLVRIPLITTYDGDENTLIINFHEEVNNVASIIMVACEETNDD